MADLVLNISFEESRKLNHVVVETYEGSIPQLKSRQYSGPLRNSNINKISATPDNLSSIDFKTVKEYLLGLGSMQISKHQYALRPSSLRGLLDLAQLQCLFYKQRKEPMFQVDSIEFCDEAPRNAIHLRGVSISGEKNELRLAISSEHADGPTITGTCEAYVDLAAKDHKLQLIFNYGNFQVRYDPNEQDFKHNLDTRNYRLEESALVLLKRAGWNSHGDEGFIYSGKAFQKDLLTLVDNGVKVFTQERKPVVKGDFSNIHVEYDIDWFMIKGNISVGQEEIKIEDLIDLTRPNSQWIEINGSILSLPKTVHAAVSEGKNRDGGIVLPKQKLITAVDFAQGIGQGAIDGLSNLVNCENIHPKINETIFSVLRPYQRTGVKWLLALYENGFGGCLADDMGLGKTLQAIAYLSDIRMHGSNNLIVVPKTLLANWEREFAKFSPEINIYIYHGTNRHIPKILPQVLITTYGTLLHDIERFSQLSFKNLIIDEAQFIKNPNSKKHKAVDAIDAATKILLTGTPVENNIKEYWGLMKLANPRIFERRCFSRSDIAYSDEIERIRVITSPFLLRRTKQDVLDDLPDKFIQTIYCTMDDSQAQLYRRMLESIRHEIGSYGTRFMVKQSSSVLKGLLYLQEICCHPLLLGDGLNPSNCTDSIKLNLLLDLLDERQSAGHKVVVFSRFTQMLRIIEDELIKRHYACYYLDGKTRKRMEVVDEFEKNANGVFLISLKVGGTGLNLVSADTVILYDPWWNPAIEEQAQDRVFRIGQTKDVMIYKLIVAGTIEEKIQFLQEKKQELFDHLLEGHELPTSMTIKEMVKLLEC